MRAEGLLQRFSAMGAGAQAVVPGIYAWAVTVAPVVIDLRLDRGTLGVWAHGTSTVARFAALLAPLWLLAGPAAERRWDARGRVASLWGFVLSCALAWSAAPAAVGPLRIDAPRGVAGMVGWALFALAAAAPALHHSPEDDERIVREAPLVPRRGQSKRVDSVYLAGGALLAALLQGVGWRVAGAERALLVRFVALAAGLAVIGAATELALARHVRRAPRSRARRLRSAMAMLVALALLGLTGVIFGLR
jgi:hypothetical protein